MLHFKCGCGIYNYNFQDWISHFKYGRGFFHAMFFRAMRHLLMTEIKLKKED